MVQIIMILHLFMKVYEYHELLMYITLAHQRGPKVTKHAANIYNIAYGVPHREARSVSCKILYSLTRPIARSTCTLKRAIFWLEKHH